MSTSAAAAKQVKASTAVRGSLLRGMSGDSFRLTSHHRDKDAATEILNHRLIVGIGAGTHFCAFARFVTELQTFFSPPIVSQHRWLGLRNDHI